MTPLDVYFHMTNHYKKLKKVKSVIDTSCPAGYDSKTRVKKKNRSSSKKSSLKSTPDSSPKRTHNSEQSAPGKTILSRDIKTERSQSLPSRPPTRRNLSDTPHLKQNSSRSRSSGSAKRKGLQKTRLSRQQIIAPKKHVVAITGLSAKNEATNFPSKSNTNEKSCVSSMKLGTECISEHDYQQFCLRITEDIIRNDLYGIKDMHRVFNSHIEANRGRLDMDLMKKQVQELCEIFGISLDESHPRNFTDLPTSKRCICSPNVKGQVCTEKKDCACTIQRSIPLACERHCINTLVTAPVVNPMQDVLQIYDDFNDIEEVVQEDELLRQQLHSLSCITEKTEPTTSRVINADKLEVAEVREAKESNKQCEIKQFRNEIDEFSNNVPAVLPTPMIETITSLHNLSKPKNKINNCENCNKEPKLSTININDNNEIENEIKICNGNNSKDINDSNTIAAVPETNGFESQVAETATQASPNKSTMQIIQLTQKSNIKVRGPNNEVIEYILPPGPIYIPNSVRLKNEDSVNITQPDSPKKNSSPIYSELHTTVTIRPDYPSSACSEEVLNKISLQEQLKPEQILDRLKNSRVGTVENSQLNNYLLTTDYDLTPQRDCNTVKDKSLLLSDKYEIKNVKDNFSPYMMSQFYPDNATQTSSSDWILSSTSFLNQPITEIDNLSINTQLVYREIISKQLEVVSNSGSLTKKIVQESPEPSNNRFESHRNLTDNEDLQQSMQDESG